MLDILREIVYNGNVLKAMKKRSTQNHLSERMVPDEFRAERPFEEENVEGSFGAGKPNESWESSEFISFHVLSPLQDKNSEAGLCLYSSGLV